MTELHCVVTVQSHWCLPRNLDGKPIEEFLFSRHTGSQLPPYYTDSRSDATGGTFLGGCFACFGGQPPAMTSSRPGRCTTNLLTPSQAQFWSKVAAASKAQIKAPKMADPNMDLLADLFYGAQIFDSEWMGFMKDAKVHTIQGQVQRMLRNAVVVDGGRVVPCDVMLCCTGFSNTYRLFDEATLAALGRGEDGMYLYRSVIPTEVPCLAFVGSEVGP